MLPYFSKFQHLPKLLKPLGINVIFRFNSCFKNILIKNSPQNDNNIIYKIPCNDCNGSYVGQTSKALDIRIKQHKYNVRNGNENSAIFKHISNYNHNIDWENSCKIINSNNWLERNIIETFIINFNSNSFNISPGLCVFDPTVSNLLKTDLKNILSL